MRSYTNLSSLRWNRWHYTFRQAQWRLLLSVVKVAVLLGFAPAFNPDASTSAQTTTNQIGRLTSSGNGQRRTSYEYDALGRPIQTVHKFEGQSKTFTTAYGYPQNPTTTPGLGTVPSFQLFPDNERVDYTYDASGAQQSIKTTPSGGSQQTIISSILRNARGQTTRAVYGNNAVTTYAYNDATNLRLNQIKTVVGAQVLQDYGYSFDNNGNVIAMTDAVPPFLNATYGYDSLDQLISMTWPSGQVFTYSYDRLGNLTHKEGVNQTYYSGGLGRGPHALASSGGVTYNYDFNGNLTSSSNGTTITWNSENMATRVVQGGVTINHKFFLGEGVWKKFEPGLSLTTYYLPSMRIENGQARKFFGGFAERSPNGSLKFYHGDHLGSASLVTNTAGIMIRRQAYMPYGADRFVDSNGFPDARYQFNFKEKESTGFYDYGARLYNPATGRWLSADSNTSDGLNRYAYVRNNPLRYIDPTGHYIPTQLIKKFGEDLLSAMRDKLKAKIDEKVKNEILRTFLQKGLPEALKKLKGAKGPLLSLLVQEMINPSTVYTGDLSGRVARVVTANELATGRLGDPKANSLDVVIEESLISHSSKYGKNLRSGPTDVNSIISILDPESQARLKGASQLFVVTFDRPFFDKPTLISPNREVIPNKPLMELRNIELYVVGKEP